jgi:ribosomal protein S18 acetylase RimI-like enzyme
MDRRLKLAAMVATVMVLLASHGAIAQEEIPPAGKGRVVVVASGWSGPLNYRDIAHPIAALGYDVVLFDSRIWIPTQDRGLRDAIAQAQRMPHALPGKVGLVGFSLGGGLGRSILHRACPWRRIALRSRELLTIAVRPAERRRGAGRRLLQAVIKRVRKAGARALFLEVGAGNPAARRLYEAVGFQSIGIRPGYYQRDGGTPADAVVMQLILD